MSLVGVEYLDHEKQPTNVGAKEENCSLEEG